jgi:dTDP-6-deoxy-L-talose 4-dehydrogenase (NAD+)
LGKDTLHRFLRTLAANKPFTLQWVRLFYLHGEGQRADSIIPMLDAAIKRGDTHFNMSAGDQLRDYIRVEEAARRLALLVEKPLDGTFNCCSGVPISVRSLVENHIAEQGASIRLNLGVYPYSRFEPLAFWGSTLKTASLFE